MANNYKISLDAEIRNLKDITSQVQNVGKNLKVKIDVDSGNITKKTEKINKDLYTTITLTERLNKKTGEISTTQEVNYNHTKKLDDELKNRIKLEGQVGDASKKATETTSSGLNKNLLSIENIKASMKTAIVRTIEWATSMFLVYSAMHKLKEAINIVIALDNQMTNIRMVTGATNEEAKQLLKTFQGLAKETSSTTSEIAKSGEVWLRQGRSIADTNTLIETSAVLSKVAFIESAKSAELLTSAINGYKIEAQDAMSVVDKMSAIDVNAATGTDELAEALQQTSSSAQLAGLSLDKTLAYIATISEVTRQSGATIGQSLKTVFARINQVKLGKLVDDDTGEDVSRVETVLKEYKLKLRDTEGQFRDTGMVIDELAMKWVKLTSAEKSEIAEQFAGVRMKDKFLTLMNNYNRALELEEVSLNSAGSAMEKFNIYQESTQAKMSELKNEFEIFATNTIDSKLIKSIIDLGKALLQFANSDIGQLSLKLIALATVLSLATKGFNLLKLEMMKVQTSTLLKTIQGLYFGTLNLTGGIKALTVAMLESPLFVPMVIIGGIIALTSVVDKFTTTLEEQSDVVKEHANKLQELQSEYDILMGKTELTNIEDARLKLLQQEISATKELLKQEAKRQYEMGKGSKNKGSQWGYEDTPKTDSNVTTKLSESVKAYQELQSEVTNTSEAEYNRQLKLSELSKEMSISAQGLLDLKEKGVELTSEDQNLIDAIIKITEVQKEQANTSEEVHDAYAVSQQVVDDYVAELQYLDSVEQSVRDGGSLSLEQKDELIKKYPQLTDQIVRTSEGWRIEASSLEILRVQALQTANDKMSAEKADLENRKSVLLAKLKLDQAEIKSAQAVTNAMFARAKANPNFRGSSQGFGSPEQQELINLFGQISEIDALIGQVGTISGGRVSGGKAPSTSQKKEKTQEDTWKKAFDTQYKLLQHNLTMNKITEAEYLDSLDKLYKKYFAGKKKYSEEFMQYEEEVYTKRAKLEEELLKKQLEKRKELLEKQTESINSLVDLVVDMIKQEKNTEKDYYKTLMDAEKERHDKVIENLQDEVESKKKLLEDELEGYRKIIESQLESLRIKESERDFNKDLVENQKELARLESELREVSTDDTAEGKAKKLALEEEIAKQRIQINELQHDREIELTEDSLNNELTKYEENIQSQLDEYDEYLKNEEERYTESLDNRLEDYQSYVDDIDTYLSKEGLLRQEANRRIETDGKNLYGQLTLYNSEYGKMSEDAMTTMWNTATGAMSAYEQRQMSVLDTLRTLSKEMNKVTSALGGEPIDTEVGTTAKGKQQLNQQKYLHDQMLIAQKTGNKGLENWVVSERKKWGLDIKTGAIKNVFHEGLDAGFVGGKSLLKSNEEFSLLLKGEGVLTPSQMDRFMKRTLPSMLGMKPSFTSGGSQDITISVPITFTGNVDNGTIPLIQKVVKSAVNEAIGKINKTMGQTGQIRNAKAISI